MTKPEIIDPCRHRGKPGTVCSREKGHAGDHNETEVAIKATHIIEELVLMREDFIRSAARLDLLIGTVTEAVGGCIHPRQERIPQGAFSCPDRFKCRACGDTFNGPALGEGRASA